MLARRCACRRCTSACIQACSCTHTHTFTQHPHVHSRFPEPPRRSTGPACSASLPASAPASRPSRLSLSRNSGVSSASMAAREMRLPITRLECRLECGVSASMAARASAFVPGPSLPPAAPGSNRGASSVCPNLCMSFLVVCFFAERV